MFWLVTAISWSTCAAIRHDLLSRCALLNVMADRFPEIQMSYTPASIALILAQIFLFVSHVLDPFP